jgi:hypothetical protein
VKLPNWYPRAAASITAAKRNVDGGADGFSSVLVLRWQLPGSVRPLKEIFGGEPTLITMKDVPGEEPEPAKSS